MVRIRLPPAVSLANSASPDRPRGDLKSVTRRNSARQAGLRYVVEVKARANLPACRADPDRSVPADDRSADDGLGQAPRERPTLCSGHDQHDPSRLDEHRRTPRSSAFVPARSSSPAICRPMISEWYSNGVSLNSPAIVEY